MFGDAKEELERINSELLEQAQMQEQLDEDTVEVYPDESTIGELSGGYQNYSNGYNSYNADKTDVDMEDYAQEVLMPKKDKSLTFLTVLAYCLTGAIVLVLLFGWLYLRKMI